MKLERLEELLASLQALISLSTPRRSIEAKHLAEELAFFCQNAIYSEEQLCKQFTILKFPFEHYAFISMLSSFFDCVI
jgi:hypothetical protein